MNNITRPDAAQVAARVLEPPALRIPPSATVTTPGAAWDAQGREWKFQRDVSIAGDDAHKCEMVT